MFFQLILCIGIWVVGWVVTWIRDFPTFFPLPMLGKINKIKRITFDNVFVVK